ncbi:MAG: homocysteine S-methyltransferase family protein [Candidatus Marinimicrobia bacterium]|nr:homocysteine S-methyltransferase family protein [Candidatus Neomarinimicrobiota bacterium]
MNFSEYLSTSKRMVLDGPMGTELHRRGIDTSLPLWSAAAIRENPAVIQAIHIDYIDAGADIITSNTFRTNTRTFRKAGLTENDAKLATFRAVELGRNAVNNVSHKDRIWIAGSISPLEDCYRPDLSPDYSTALLEHREKARWLADAGVDFILIETMNNFQEAKAAVEAAVETGLPVALSFILIDKDHILNGGKIIEAYDQLKDAGIQLFSINCCHHQIISDFISKYSRKIRLPLMVYPNAGHNDRVTGWKTDPDFTPQSYSKIAARWFEHGVKIIGGCCGTSPKYIQQIK